jgi:hypothetical protein
MVAVFAQPNSITSKGNKAAVSEGRKNIRGQYKKVENEQDLDT